MGNVAKYFIAYMKSLPFGKNRIIDLVTLKHMEIHFSYINIIHSDNNYFVFPGRSFNCIFDRIVEDLTFAVIHGTS
jgi:hypothetical protein